MAWCVDCDGLVMSCVMYCVIEMHAGIAACPDEMQATANERKGESKRGKKLGMGIRVADVRKCGMP